MQSMSLPTAITGFPEPHLAVQAVGMPAMPCSIVKPFFFKMSVRYLEVSNSWKPSSPKLNTMSTISCVNFVWLSISLAISVFSASILAGFIFTCATVFTGKAIIAPAAQPIAQCRIFPNKPSVFESISGIV
ncbi:hypothetical protein D3C87_1738430 [compost metagenome]